MWLPYKRIKITSNRSKSEVLDLIKQSCQPKRIFSNGDPKIPLSGKVNDHSFAVSRTITYGNSFLPIAKPKFEKNGVYITMKMYDFVSVWMGLWLLGVFIFWMRSLFFEVNEFREDKVLLLIIPPLMLVFGYLLMMIPFNIEANRTEKILRELIT